MNIQHLRYALEVARVGSISQAAENLYMGQPNLSKAIKELEQSLNVSIFKRTSRGAEVTPKGREFLRYARGILVQFEAMEALGKDGDPTEQALRVTVPRAGYMVSAFTDLLARLDPARPINVSLMETNTQRSIRYVADGRADFGAIRCQLGHMGFFHQMIEENQLESHELLQFQCRLLVSRASPLAQLDEVPAELLSGFIEVVHGDTAVPGDQDGTPDTEASDAPKDKKVYVYEHSSQNEILARVPGTYMWAAPVPRDSLEKNGLVQLKSVCAPRVQDSFIYQKNHTLTTQDTQFMADIKLALERAVSQLMAE